MLWQHGITPCETRLELEVQDVMPCCQGNIQGNQSSLPIYGLPHK